MDHKLIYRISREVYSRFPTNNAYYLLDYYIRLSTNGLEGYANTSAHSEEVLQNYFNFSIPCIKNELAKPNVNNLTAMEPIWVNCFKDTCRPNREADLEAVVNLIMVLVGWVVLFFATIFTKRVSFHKDKCCGRPGIVVPVNMLDNYENRYGYSAAIALAGSASLNVILGSYEYLVGYKGKQDIDGLPSYLKVFVRMQFTFFVSTIAIPFFILQNMKNRVFGSVLGLLLSILWSSMLLFKTSITIVACDEKYKYDQVEGVRYFYAFYDVPALICQCFLVIKFAIVLYKTAKERMKTKGIMAMLQNHDDTNWRNEFVFKYVQKVINQKKKVEKDDDNEEEEEREFKEKLKIKICENAYKHNPDFFYSSRLMMGAATSCTVVYTLSLIVGVAGYVFFIRNLDEWLGTAGIELIENELNISKDTVKDYNYCIMVSWWLALLLAIAVFFFSLSNSFTWYRKHVVMLRKGDRSFLPNSVLKGKVDPPSLMVASMKFAGFQVAYSTWGFIISFLIWFIIMVILTTQIFLPMHTKELSYLLQLLISAWSSIVFAIVMMVVQNIAARYCFLVDKDTLAVDNRRAFHVYSYFMFFYNIFLGLASCLMRIIYGLIFGVLFLQRLQKSTLPKSYAKRDPGFLAYVGYILLENQHANPVMQCFVNLMLEQNAEDKSFRSLRGEVNKSILDKEGGSDNGSIIAYDEEDWQLRNKEYRKIRMRNKWHLYKMLIQNPSLRKYRAKPKKIQEKTLRGAIQNFFNVGTMGLVRHSCQPKSDDEKDIIILKEIPLAEMEREEKIYQVKETVSGQPSFGEGDNEGRPLISFDDKKPSYQSNASSNNNENGYVKHIKDDIGKENNGHDNEIEITPVMTIIDETQHEKDIESNVDVPEKSEDVIHGKSECNDKKQEVSNVSKDLCETNATGEEDLIDISSTPTHLSRQDKSQTKLINVKSDTDINELSLNDVRPSNERQPEKDNKSDNNLNVENNAISDNQLATNEIKKDNNSKTVYVDDNIHHENKPYVNLENSDSPL